MTTSDQFSPHASHCSCKYEVEALRREVERQKVVVEAARVALKLEDEFGDYDLDDIRRAVNALDKATGVRGQ